MNKRRESVSAGHMLTIDNLPSEDFGLEITSELPERICVESYCPIYEDRPKRATYRRERKAEVLEKVAYTTVPRGGEMVTIPHSYRHYCGNCGGQLHVRGNGRFCHHCAAELGDVKRVLG